jgi:hypothetical protein
MVKQWKMLEKDQRYKFAQQRKNLTDMFHHKILNVTQR